MADEGRTVVLSSHIIDEVDRACDTVAIIREGFMVAVETIDALSRRSLREVRITLDHDVDRAEFIGLLGVHDVPVDARTLSVRTAGDIDAVTKRAARHHGVDLVSERADLESIFLAFYGSGAATTAEPEDGTG